MLLYITQNVFLGTGEFFGKMSKTRKNIRNDVIYRSIIKYILIFDLILTMVLIDFRLIEDGYVSVIQCLLQPLMSYLLSCHFILNLSFKQIFLYFIKYYK